MCFKSRSAQELFLHRTRSEAGLFQTTIRPAGRNEAETAFVCNAGLHLQVGRAGNN